MDAEAIEAFADELGNWVVSEAAKPYDGSTEFNLFCPYHEHPDESRKPSATWQPKANNSGYTLGVFRCHKPGCELPADALRVRETWARAQELRAAGGDPNEARKAIAESVGKWKPKSSAPDLKARKRIKGRATLNAPIDDDVWEAYRECLFEDDQHVSWWLADKGITGETLLKFNFAWHSNLGCYIYRVNRLDGEVEGWRIYDPFHLQGDSPRDKKRWYRTRDHHTNQLWGLQQADLEADTLILAEGETDLMLMHQDGFTNVVAQTGGAGTWRAEWCETFRDKHLIIAYDPDDAGRKGRALVSKTLHRIARSVSFLELPDGDYCEWRADGHTPVEFKELLDEAEVDWASAGDELPTEGIPLRSVSQLKDATADRVLELRAYVAGKAETPWSLPKRISLTCGKNQGKKCDACPRAGLAAGEQTPVEFSPHDDDTLVTMMEEDNPNLDSIIAGSMDLRCSVIEWEAEEQWMVEQISVQDPVDANLNIMNDSRYAAYHFYDSSSKKLDPSHDYKLIARRLPDPRSQRLTVLVWNAEKTTTDLDAFHMSDEVKERLKMFRPPKRGLQSLKIHLRRKYKDLAINVTKIAGRDDLHFLWDLIAHSPKSFSFDNVKVNKGMLDGLVFGDTRTGKSECDARMRAHYGIGYSISGENTSFAGLIGGSVEVTGSRSRMPDWGVLPRHHLRFVTIDESSNMDEIISRMSDVRTSGVAQINKIGGGRVPAMVRILWMANPVSGDRSGKTRQISDYNGGAIGAIQDLIKSQEDIARFDLVMVVASEEVDEDQIEALRSATTPHVYTSEACHAIAMFAWTRKPSQIQFADGVTELLYEAKRRLAAKYIAQPPLVQASNFDQKLARMCVSLASMVYSTAEDGETVLVLPEHVQYIEEFIQRTYDNPWLGYGGASKQKHEWIQLGKDNAEIVEAYFNGEPPKELNGLPNGKVAADILLMVRDVPFDSREVTQLSEEVGTAALIRYLSSVGMLEPIGRRVRVSRALYAIIQKVKDKQEEERREAAKQLRLQAIRNRARRRRDG